MNKLKVKKLRPDAKLPTYGTIDAAGADLYACIDKNIIIAPGENKIIPIGIAIEIPINYGGFVYARSGLSIKDGLAPANCVGVIDADYRGELLVALYNHSRENRIIASGDRIAQIVIAPFLKAEFTVVNELSKTQRDAGRLGSTGTK